MELDQNQTSESTPKEEKKTKRSTRIFALIGAILMILLTIMYSYSIATGNIFKW